MRVYNFKTPVYEFADTGIQVHRHRKREFFAILGDLKVEIEKSENMGGLRIPPRYGIKQKKISKILCHCPFNAEPTPAGLISTLESELS